MSSKKSVVVSPSGAASAPKLHLGYWDIRGLAQAIRYLLYYAGAPVEEIRYSVGDAKSGYDAMAWIEDKADNPFAVDFPNLPFLVDDDAHVALSQSSAILRHVGRKFSLLGNDEVTQSLNDVLISEAEDFRSTMGFAYSESKEEFNKKRGDFETRRLPSALDALGGFLQRRGKGFLLGDTPLVADFIWFEATDVALIMCPNGLSSLANDRLKAVKEWRERFLSLPKIAEYRKHSAFIERPINNKMAQFK